MNNTITIYFRGFFSKKWLASFLTIFVLIGFYFFRNDFDAFFVDTNLSYIEKEKRINHLFITLSVSLFCILQINRNFFLKEDIQVLLRTYTATDDNKLSYRDHSALAAFSILVMLFIFYYWAYPSHPTDPNVYYKHKTSLIRLENIHHIYFYFFIGLLLLMLNIFMMTVYFSALDLSRFLRKLESNN